MGLALQELRIVGKQGSGLFGILAVPGRDKLLIEALHVGGAARRSGAGVFIVAGAGAQQGSSSCKYQVDFHGWQNANMFWIMRIERKEHNRSRFSRINT